jgi:hypothetical protein
VNVSKLMKVPIRVYNNVVGEHHLHLLLFSSPELD